MNKTTKQYKRLLVCVVPFGSGDDDVSPLYYDFTTGTQIAEAVRNESDCIQILHLNPFMIQTVHSGEFVDAKGFAEAADYWSDYIAMGIWHSVNGPIRTTNNLLKETMRLFQPQDAETIADFLEEQVAPITILEMTPYGIVEELMKLAEEGKLDFHVTWITRCSEAEVEAAAKALIKMIMDGGETHTIH